MFHIAGTQLQRSIRKDDETIKSLKSENQKAKETMVKVKAKLMKELTALQVRSQFVISKFTDHIEKFALLVFYIELFNTYYSMSQ